jgi:hypothetical protein
MISFSHFLGCALELTVLPHSSSDCLYIYYYFFSRLRLQLSIILSVNGLLYLWFLWAIESRFPTYLSTALFHGPAFSLLQSRLTCQTPLTFFLNKLLCWSYDLIFFKLIIKLISFPKLETSWFLL